MTAMTGWRLTVGRVLCWLGLHKKEQWWNGKSSDGKKEVEEFCARRWRGKWCSWQRWL